MTQMEINLKLKTGDWMLIQNVNLKKHLERCEEARKFYVNNAWLEIFDSILHTPIMKEIIKIVLRRESVIEYDCSIYTSVVQS